MKTNRGGQREGAGRKPLPPSERRSATVTFRVREDIKELLQDLRSENVDVTYIISGTISRLWDVYIGRYPDKLDKYRPKNL